METVEGYFQRKSDELRLLNECLRSPLSLTTPQSVAEVVREKLRLSAALKAEHELRDWTGTETGWFPRQHRSGPFEFTYDYQRADLDVRGPPVYGLMPSQGVQTVYAASGMSAIAALLLACTRLVGEADIMVPPGSYGETQELIETYANGLCLVGDSRTRPSNGNEPACRIILIDSSLSCSSFEAASRDMQARPDLLIFDTTCFPTDSGRIRCVVNWAKQRNCPLAMVRSHMKLDSLGAEYGRLGSIVFIDHEEDFSRSRSSFRGLPAELRNAVRLLGGAALPAHFPPYVGRPTYRALMRRRVAAIIRNSRRSSRHLANALPGLTAELRYAHGLYFTLKGAQPLSEEGARKSAAALSEALGQNLPIQHAGSFGFDFAATEWLRDRERDQYVIRVSVPDLPAPLWDELSEAIGNWWLENNGRQK
jgi:hypothetical protein